MRRPVRPFFLLRERMDVMFPGSWALIYVFIYFKDFIHSFGRELAHKRGGTEGAAGSPLLDTGGA